LRCWGRSLLWLVLLIRRLILVVILVVWLVFALIFREICICRRRRSSRRSRAIRRRSSFVFSYSPTKHRSRDACEAWREKRRGKRGYILGNEGGQSGHLSL
jgi:hypothetical protein